MGLTTIEKAELDANQLRDVAQIWYEQWKDSRPLEESPIKWEGFKEAFFDRFFLLELRKLKMQEFINLKQGVSDVKIMLRACMRPLRGHVRHVTSSGYPWVVTSIVTLEGLGVDESLSYEEVPVQILDRQVKKLRNKEFASVNVLWRNHLVEGATWEAKADMMSRYPQLYPSNPTLAWGNEFLMVWSMVGLPSSGLRAKSLNQTNGAFVRPRSMVRVCGSKPQNPVSDDQ
ncbi:hypothetical protein MTR67_052373 [Solanum verrucosum]|uniref:Retrotransposon gag domain-containing protein n=1 Tax=Solanum verrucosum TaxID=315347 RepID=A0AAF0V4Y1_SOLVR|nr:hypothetical protein MTR67_052373 [Solanum verrucosum]